jgi:hypothetical protein
MNIRRNAWQAIAALVLGAGWAAVPAAAQDGEWLCMSSKAVTPIVFRKTGVGTANAVAEARITRDAVKGHCENWEPGNVAACLARELAGEEGKVYRATADCRAGRITTADGGTFTLAGVWDNSDIGGGRTKWRDADGKVVGRDNASGGLCISQQWELLCPAPPPSPRRTAPGKTPAKTPRKTAAAAPVAEPAGATEAEMPAAAESSR